MKQPVVDYKSFRLRRVNEPQYAHIKLLLGWVGYFALYFLTENLIPAEACHVVHSRLDDLIPFNEYFVIFYISWFALIVFSLLAFFLYDIQSFKDLSKFIIVTQVVAIAVYILWPNRQDLRPDSFEHRNLCTMILGFLYTFDTPTGVCPSLHVAYSLGIGSVWLKKMDASPIWKAVLLTDWDRRGNALADQITALLSGDASVDTGIRSDLSRLCGGLAKDIESLDTVVARLRTLSAP